MGDSIAGLVTAGVGVVSAALGVYLLVDAKALEEDARAYCLPSDPSQCDDDGMVLLDTAATELLWGEFTVGLGAAAAFGGAAAYVWGPERSDSGSAGLGNGLVPVVGSGSASLSWHGSF